MNRIFRYELISLFLGKGKFQLFLGMLLLSLAYLAMALNNNVPDGITALGEGLSFFSSIMVFLVPIFAGLVLSQSFEDRMIQNSLMSGQKRSSVVLGKSQYFFFLSSMVLLIPTFICTVTVTMVKGWNSTGQTLDLGTLLIQALLFIMLVAAAYMIVLPIAFYCKKTGATIGLGLLTSILLYSLTQELIQRESLHTILQWTPLGNSYFIFNESGLGLVKALAIIILWTGLCVAVTWLGFRREELK